MQAYMGYWQQFFPPSGLGGYGFLPPRYGPLSFLPWRFSTQGYGLQRYGPPPGLGLDFRGRGRGPPLGLPPLGLPPLELPPLGLPPPPYRGRGAQVGLPPEPLLGPRSRTPETIRKAVAGARAKPPEPVQEAVNAPSRPKFPEIPHKDPGKAAKKVVPFGHNHSDLTYQQLVDAGDKAYKLFKNRGHYAHELSKLVEQACHNLGSKKMTPKQADGINTIRKSMDRGSGNGSDSKEGPATFMHNSGFDLADAWRASDETVLNNFYRKFDEIFFFGTLAGRCSWAIDWQTVPHVLGYCQPVELFGYNTQVGAVSPHTKCIIKLQKSPFPDRERRLMSYLGTLLHEMCHAFMITWSCDEGSCARNSDLVGVTGHGNAWMNTCVAVDRAVRKHLGLRLRFARALSYATEVVDGGAEVEGKRYLEHWEIEERDLREQIRAYMKLKERGGFRA